MPRADEWSPIETGKHQDHVIAHILGTTALGYFIADEAAHLLLDIGFIWTIYVDVEMGLLPQGVTIDELALDTIAKTELLDDVTLLHDGGDPSGLKRMSLAPAAGVITEVTCDAQAERRRVLVHGEDANLAIETSLADEALRVVPA